MHRWGGYQRILLTLPNPDYKYLASSVLFLAKSPHSGFTFYFEDLLNNFQLLTNKAFPSMKPPIKKTFILSYQELCHEHMKSSMVLGIVKNYVLSASNIINNNTWIKLKVRYIA